ncbi:MAG: phage tail tube protein [Thermodesulfobacteriota bacterium]
MTRSIRNFLATHNLLAVSAQHQEAALNQEQELDTTLLVDLNSMLNYQALKYPNREEVTGKEEADRLHDLGGTVAGSLSFSRAQPQHFAFVLAYALGAVETAPAGISGFRHTIRPRQGEVDVARSNPSFTAALRYGGQVMKRRFASCFLDQVRVEWPKDGWAKITGTVKGTGKVTDNTQTEEVTAPYNAASLTLAANGVAGDTPAARLSNVQAVQVNNPATLAWEEVSYSAVSAATPAAITITPPGGTGESTSYRVYYLPVESDWMAFPPRVEEPPLKVSQTMVNLGGRWDGSAFQGGHTLTAELRRLVWTLNNHLTPERTPGAGVNYANRAFRTGREQKLVFDRDFRDFLLAQHLKDNDYLALYLKAVGPEFETGFYYQVELVFPRVALVSAPVRAAQRRLAEEAEFAILEDDTYGSTIAYVQNQVSGYAG